MDAILPDVLLMNFGPINQRGGEKRLNVIFSRAKHHMAIVSSIRHSEITNDYNDGANSLKNFLEYAESVSRGDEVGARRVLENINPHSRRALSPLTRNDAAVESLATALRARGYMVDTNVGQSKSRCDLAVRSHTDSLYELGILVDTDAHYANPNLLDRYLLQPSILQAFGWRFAMVLTKDWYHTPDDVLSRLERLLRGQPGNEPGAPEVEPPTSTSPNAVEDAADEPAADSLEAVLGKNKDVDYDNDPDTVAAASPPAAVDGSNATVLASPGSVNVSPTTAGTSTSVRHFELVAGSSSKFWEVSINGNAMGVRFGRIGTNGQEQTKTFADPTNARHEADRLIAEKLKKGYIEKAVPE